MRFTDEFDIFNFEFYGGAYTKTVVLEQEEMCMLEDYIKCSLGDTLPSRKDINEFVQFDCEDFFDALLDLQLAKQGR